MDAAVSGMRGTEMAVLETLQASASQSSTAETAITMIAATLRSGSDANVQATLAMVADANRPAWQRAAVLLGAGGRARPEHPDAGNARRGGALDYGQRGEHAGAPCPTCPGGRGPGRRTRFVRRPLGRRRARGGAGGGRGGAGGGRRLVEPRAGLVYRVRFGARRSADARHQRARQNRLAGQARPAHAAHRGRAAALRRRAEVYRNVCQACHQPDGRGLERVAPPLVDRCWHLRRRRSRRGSCSTARKGPSA